MLFLHRAEVVLVSVQREVIRGGSGRCGVAIERRTVIAPEMRRNAGLASTATARVRGGLLADYELHRNADAGPLGSPGKGPGDTRLRVFGRRREHLIIPRATEGLAKRTLPQLTSLAPQALPLHDQHSSSPAHDPLSPSSQ